MTPEQADQLLSIASNPELMEVIGVGKPWTKKDIEELVEYSRADRVLSPKEKTNYTFVMLVKNHVVGFISLRPAKSKMIYRNVDLSVKSIR